MNIALTALQQRHFLTGTGRCIAEVFRWLPRIEGGAAHHYLLYARPEQVKLFEEVPPRSRIRVVEDCPASPYKRVLWEATRLPGVVRHDAVDLYHGPANFLPLRKTTPQVLTLHDMFFFKNPKRTFWLRSAYWRWMLKATWRHADLIITDSEYSRKDICHYLPVNPARIRVVPCGVDEKFFVDTPAALRSEMRAALGLDRPYVLYVGRLDPDKNMRGVVLAYAELVKRGVAGVKDTMLVIAGEKDYRSSELPELAKTLGIGDRTKFVGYVEERFLIPLYQEARTFCYPSFNEGFGLPPLEAMAAGVPVVTSNSSSLPEVVGDAAVQVEPANTSEIAAGIEKTLDPGRAAELRERGRARARTFSWKRTAEQTLEVYEDVLKGRIA